MYIQKIKEYIYRTFFYFILAMVYIIIEYTNNLSIILRINLIINENKLFHRYNKNLSFLGHTSLIHFINLYLIYYNTLKAVVLLM